MPGKRGQNWLKAAPCSCVHSVQELCRGARHAPHRSCLHRSSQGQSCFPQNRRQMVYLHENSSCRCKDLHESISQRCLNLHENSRIGRAKGQSEDEALLLEPVLQLVCTAEEMGMHAGSVGSDDVVAVVIREGAG